jgi:hypothetical protein
MEHRDAPNSTRIEIHRRLALPLRLARLLDIIGTAPPDALS